MYVCVKNVNAYNMMREVILINQIIWKIWQYLHRHIHCFDIYCLPVALLEKKIYKQTFVNRGYHKCKVICYTKRY